MDSDDSNVLTFPTKTSPDKSTEWPADVRALALELFYTEAGRKLAALERILAAKPYEIPVPYQTLWYWHRVDQWDIEADKRMAAFAPNRRRRTAPDDEGRGDQTASTAVRGGTGARGLAMSDDPYRVRCPKCGGLMSKEREHDPGICFMCSTSKTGTWTPTPITPRVARRTRGLDE